MDAPIPIGIHLGQHMGHDDVGAARLIEEVGLDRVWMGDGLWGTTGREPLVTAGALLQATSRVTVGVNVINASTSLPQHLARQVATLESLFPGRFILGLGIGYHKRLQRQAEWGYPVRTDVERVEFLAETAEYLTRFFAGDHVTFEGKHIVVRDAEICPAVGRKPRFLIGGGRVSVLKIAARYADLWDGMAIWTFGAGKGEAIDEYYRRKEAILIEECRAIGRDPAEITRCLTAYAALANSVEEAEAIAEEQAPYIPDRPQIVGTPDTAIAFLLEAHRLGVREIQIVPVTRGGNDAMFEFIQTIGRDVAPAVRAALQ